MKPLRSTIKTGFLVCAGSLSLCTVPARAQSVDNEFQLWPASNLRIPLTRKLNAFIACTPRIGMGDDEKGIQQLVTRPALAYNPNRNIGLFGSYVWLVNYGNRVRHEHRLVQQASYNMAVYNFTVTKAIRLEQRYFNHLSGTGYRLIDGIRASRPILGSRRFYGVASNLLYLNLNDVNGGPRRGFDQNRAFFGIGCRVSRNLSLEAGYIYQYINRRNAFDDTGNHILSLNTNFSL